MSLCPKNGKKESHNPSRHRSVKVAPFADGTKIVSAVPANNNRLIDPNNDARSTYSDNRQSQREAQLARWRLTCWHKNMLQEHHVGSVNGAGDNFCSAETQTP